MQRPLNEIAGDVAELLKLGDDDKTIAEIERQLDAVEGAYRWGGGDVVKADKLKADIAAERQRLQELKDKWCNIAAVQIVCSQADYVLATLAEVNGPDPRYRWLGDVCAIMAYSMIQHSPEKRLGWRHRILAGYLYEAATGIPNRTLETACRRVARTRRKQKDLPLVFERDKRRATRGVGRYVWKKEKKQARRKRL
jgi:hypothetical protein